MYTHSKYEHYQMCLFVCVCVCVCECEFVNLCYIVGNRKQYSKIDSYIPSKLWGTENKRNLPCEIQGRIEENKGEPHRSVYVYTTMYSVCVCVLHISA